MSTAFSVNIPLFFVLVIPFLLLSLLCAVALIFSEEINKKIRLLLLDVFIVDVINWLSHSVCYPGLPIAYLLQTEDALCKFCVISVLVAVVKRFIANTGYSLIVYIFVKYGEKKLKWYVTIPLVALSWILSFGVGSISYLGVVKANIFCTMDFHSDLFKITASVLMALLLLFLIIQIVCCALTVVFIKENVLEGNTSVKKAVSKVLLYLTITSILSIIYCISLIVIPFISGNKVALSYFFRRLVLNIPAVATPIVALIWLKPIRVAIKTMVKKVLCRPNNQVAPAPDTGTDNK